MAPDRVQLYARSDANEDRRMKHQTSPRHHLDRRAAEIADKGRQRDPDDLLTTKEEAGWLGTSTQWLEIGRTKGYGPPFDRIGPRCIRYRVRKTLKWLDERTHTCTSEYA